MTREEFQEKIGPMVSKLGDLFAEAGTSHVEMIIVLGWYIGVELCAYEDADFVASLSVLCSVAQDERRVGQRGESCFDRAIERGRLN